MNARENTETTSMELTAFNFAEDSSNRIHDDKVARQYGFDGGLVPGIAVFAYMCHPVVARWGSRWFERGCIRATFIKPVYAGNRVTVVAGPVGRQGGDLEINVKGPAGDLCAAGLARLSGDRGAAPRSIDYPKSEPPPPDRRWAPAKEALRPGTTLGSVAFSEICAEALDRVRRDYLDDLDIYSGTGAPYHPAYLLAQANQILMKNVDLGPWIHVKSEMGTFALPKAGEKLDIRGRIARAYNKKGHDMAELDLAIFDDGERAVAAITHTAIVRLRQEKV